VAESTAESWLASSLTFVRTGLGDRAGTTADALCSAARSGSREQRIFIGLEFSFPAGPLTVPDGRPAEIPSKPEIFADFWARVPASFFLSFLSFKTGEEWQGRRGK
jgi:hypothetical protein